MSFLCCTERMNTHLIRSLLLLLACLQTYAFLTRSHHRCTSSAPFTNSKFSANNDHIKCAFQLQMKWGGIAPFGKIEAGNGRISPGEVVREYFQRWNERDMEAAINLFDQNCSYEDTLYPEVFEGKNQLKSHLLRVGSALPESFRFVIDELTEDKTSGKVGIQWHVESDGKDLPFTRGASIYTVNKNNLIQKGFDVPEPVLKAGSANLSILKLAKNFISDPIRIVPAIAWVLYCWLLFFSTEAPGPNAFQLDSRTWEEVWNLSLNFWLIVPSFSPARAPVEHPIMEGLFNLVLVWSALFAGFIADGKRRDVPKNEIVPFLVGMQFLTNAIYLPYLITRNPSSNITKKSLTKVEQTSGEGKVLPIILGMVGLYSIYWGFDARTELFGDLATRWSSFVDLASSDRLTFAFVVDAIYYSLFQGWLINDDAKRRNLDQSSSISQLGKFVPFFGLLVYLSLRPPLPATDEE